MYRLLPFVVATFLPVAAVAEIIVEDAYLRVSRPGAPTGAAFMTLKNTGDTPVQFTGGASEIAPQVHLHTHIDNGDGVLRMRPVEGGFEIPAGGAIRLERGADHLMFLGLSDTYETGDSVSVTLTFDGAEDLTLDIGVDNERLDLHQSHDGHGDHKDHGNHDTHGDHKAHGDH